MCPQLLGSVWQHQAALNLDRGISKQSGCFQLSVCCACLHPGQLEVGARKGGCLSHGHTVTLSLSGKAQYLALALWWGARVCPELPVGTQ